MEHTTPTPTPSDAVREAVHGLSTLEVSPEEIAADRGRTAQVAEPTRSPAAPPAPETPAEALAARPLLEHVPSMADCIGAHTVGQITAISARAAAWLRENPPGQPVALEPRGCPAPGACSCVEPTLPTPVISSNIRAALDAAEKHATSQVWAGHQLAIILEALIKQTRAAMAAEPVGEGASPKELIGLALEREPWATWLRSGGCLESAHCELADLMLAALARWGCPECLRELRAELATAQEALRRLVEWGGFLPSAGFNVDVVSAVADWFATGMTGPLPPLPSYIASRDGLEPATSAPALPPALVFDGGNEVKIEATNRERTSWAVRSGAGCCLNRDLSWQVEPMPSHRSDDFLARCRWPSAEEAYAALLEYRAIAGEEAQA